MTDHSDMAVFNKIVECGSMTRAGRELRMTPGAITKRINKLEERLGVKLLNRTTRKVVQTQAGHEYYDKASSILRDINWLETSLSTLSENPRGLLKVTAPSLFGRKQLCPLIVNFRKKYGDVHIHLRLTDLDVDLARDGFDLAVRNLPLSDTNLVMRKLVDDRQVVCGTPEYFARHGRPQTPADLLQHDCLLLRFPGSKQYRWHFVEDGRNTSLLVKGPIDSDSSEALYDWMMSGAGLSLRSTAEVADDLRAGRLEAVLTDTMRTDRAYNVLYPRREPSPQKVKIFIDFLFESIGRHPPWDADLGF